MNRVEKKPTDYMENILFYSSKKANAISLCRLSKYV